MRCGSGSRCGREWRAAVRSGRAGRRRRPAPGRRCPSAGSSVGGAVGDRDDAQLQQLGHGGAARHVADLELVAGGGAVRAAGVVPGALEEAGVGEEGDGLGDDAGGRTGEPAGVLGGAGGAASGVDPPGGLQAGGVGGRVGVLALLLGALLQPAAGLPYEGVDAVDRDPADVAVVGEVLGAREGHRGDGEMGEAVQEAVRGVGGGAAGVVAHPDGEDGVLGGGHGHPRPRGHLQDDQPEPGGDGVGEPGERRVLAVAPQQLARTPASRAGSSLGCSPKETSRAASAASAGVTAPRSPARRPSSGSTPLGVLGHGTSVLAPAGGAAGARGAGHCASARAPRSRHVGRAGSYGGVTPPPYGPPPCPPRPAAPCPR